MNEKRYTTHKNTRAAKATTQERKRVRAIKRTPADSKSLESVARSIGARYVS